MKKAFLFCFLFLCFAVSVNAQSCQCVGYVKNRYTIAGTTTHAKNYGPILTNSSNGFTVQSTPQNKDIVILQPGFPGANATSGHIALVGTVTNNPNGSKTIVLYGANQGGSSWTEWCCSNVSTWTITVTTANSQYVRYYRNLSKLKTTCP